MSKEEFFATRCSQAGELLENSKQESHRKIGKALKDIAKVVNNEKALRLDLPKEISAPYDKMSAWWGSFTKGMGRQIQTKTTKEVSKMVGFDVDKALAGVDPEGFNNLQAMVAITQDPKVPMFQDHTFNLLFWACLISCYKPEFADDLVKATTRVVNKNLN